jgi:hypothetical protein
MADDPKSIGKSLSEISSLLKDGIKTSEGNQAAEKEASNEDRRQRSKLFGGLRESMQKIGEGFKNMLKPASGGGLFAKLLGGLGTIAMGVIGPILGFFGTAGPIAVMAAKILPFLGPAGHIAKLGLKFLGPLILLIEGFIGFFKGWANSEESNIGLRIVDGLQGAFSQILSSLTLGFVSFDVIQEFTQPFFDYIKDWFTGIFAIWDDESLGFGEKLWLTLKEYFRVWMDAMMFQFTLVKDGILATIDGLIYIFSPESLLAAGKAIGDAFNAVGGWIFDNFKRPITFFAMKIDEIVSIIKEQFFNLAASVINLVPDFLKTDGMVEMQEGFSRDAKAEARNRARTKKSYEIALEAARKEEIEEARKAAEEQAARKKKYLEKERLKKIARENELQKSQAEQDQKEAEMRTAEFQGLAAPAAPVASVAVQNNNTSVQTAPLRTRPPQTIGYWNLI